MSKYNNSSGNLVFGQLLSHLPKDRISTVIKRHGSDRYTKKFMTWDHLVVMLSAALSKTSALRGIESSIAGFHNKLLHLGMRSLPKRSTLSEANAKRSADVFADIFKVTYQKVAPFLPDSWPKNQKYMKNLFLVDSTTITLFKDILKACGRTPGNGKRKGGVKIHVGMHLSEETPSVVRITSAATNDKKFMSEFKDPAPDTILVFDKAYLNYTLYNHWDKNGVTYVTRKHKWCDISLKKELPITDEEHGKGVRGERMVEMGHPKQEQKVVCREIVFYDSEKDRELTFITNDTKMEASQIAEIYRQRWQIELLFKRLKQNLQLSDFLGDNENAIRIQIWANLIADLLLTVIRKGMKTKKAYSTVATLVRIHLMNYVKLIDLLTKPGNINIFEENHDTAQQTLKFTHPP
ncbi:MAG: IS4 family transposase [Flavobacteriales bacterium]